LYLLGYNNKYYCKQCFAKKAENWPKPWLSNDPEARRQFEEGHKWETVVYERLKADLDPIPVSLTPKSIRSHVSERSKYRNEEDIDIAGHRVEVHARKYAFTNIGDHPRELEIMTPAKKVARWGDRRPMCFIIISKVTGAMIVASVQKTQKDWKRWSQKDPLRAPEGEDVYGCPVSLMTNYDDFVTTLREKMAR